MSNVQTTGRITFIKLSYAGPLYPEGWDFCLIGLLPTGGSTADVEVFAVWWGEQLQGPPPPSAKDWILRCVQVAMLREAMEQKLDVTLMHDSGMNTFFAVQVNSP